jgi:hypothetical protein
LVGQKLFQGPVRFPSGTSYFFKETTYFPEKAETFPEDSQKICLYV